MKKFGLTKIFAVAVTSLGFSMAQAGDLIISDIVGSWQNPVGGGGTVSINNQAGQAVDTVTWGTPLTPSGPSGYTFDPYDGSYTLPSVDPLGVPFLLADFQHINHTIRVATALSSIEYDFGFSVNGDTIFGLGTVLTFSHNETPNQCSGAGCSDDIVTISNVLINSVIEVGDDTYFFNLLGFSTNGGSTTSNQFISPENGTNGAGLYGIVTTRPLNVPEPGTVALFGLGLAGLGASLRKKRSRA